MTKITTFDLNYKLNLISFTILFSINIFYSFTYYVNYFSMFCDFYYFFHSLFLTRTELYDFMEYNTSFFLVYLFLFIFGLIFTNFNYFAVVLNFILFTIRFFVIEHYYFLYEQFKN